MVVIHGLWSLWLSNKGGFLQPLHWHLQIGRFRFDSLWQPQALARPITLTLEPMRQLTRDRVLRRSGVNPTFRMEINPPMHSITRPRKEP